MKEKTTSTGPLKNRMKTFSFILLAVSALAVTNAQPLLLKYENRTLVSFEKHIYNPDSLFHTSIRPFTVTDLRKTINVNESYNDNCLITNTDSTLANYLLPTTCYLLPTTHCQLPSASCLLPPASPYNLLFNRSLIVIKGSDFTLTADPLFDFGYGYDFAQNRSQWINTRGFIVEGSLGKDFAFATTFRETQARLPLWVTDYVARRRAVPGQGWFKSFAEGTALDYANASGYVSWSPGRFFNFRAGHGKNFFGDGYRSLLLSDASFFYPYFMITTTFWKIKYINLYTQYSHPDLWWSTAGDRVFKRKYASTHYLSFVPWKKLNISLFESVIWKPSDTTYHRGFDFNYLNPIIFFRPVEFNLGSADNVIMGANLRYTPFRNFVLYGQLVIDELRVKELLSDDRWSGNKYAWQTGFRIFKLFNIENLEIQSEYNQIRPYMYSHVNPGQNYSNAREPIAHPSGANTKEAVVIAKYSYKRLFFNAKYVSAVAGLDSAGINFGKNIFLSPSTAPFEYGIKTTQGLRTKLNQLDLSASWLVNPATNANMFIGYTYRREKNSKVDNIYSYFSFGFRTSLSNIYYDFL